MVRKDIGTDSRIGPKFLYPGCGYGGSCFPKDVKALICTAREHKYTMSVIEAVEAVNERQKEIVVKKLQDKLGILQGKTIALWGLAFKPETDDLREAPALVVIDKLLTAGAEIKVYDPVAMAECKRKDRRKSNLLQRHVRCSVRRRRSGRTDRMERISRPLMVRHAKSDETSRSDRWTQHLR